MENMNLKPHAEAHMVEEDSQIVKENAGDAISEFLSATLEAASVEIGAKNGKMETEYEAAKPIVQAEQTVADQAEAAKEQLSDSDNTDDYKEIKNDDNKENELGDGSDDLGEDDADPIYFSTSSSSMLGVLAPRPVVRRRLGRRILAQYICNICHNYVRGGVITICGHLYCWSCLWPTLYDRMLPKCPRCLRHLILHEDIMPFHGEGPHADPEDSNVVAQPGNVARPAGLYLSELQYPDWFAVNDFEELAMQAAFNVEGERHLYDLVLRMKEFFPQLLRWAIFLNWTQVIIAAIMFVLWCFVSLN